MNIGDYAEAPSVSIYASVDERARDAFFDQLKKYAETHTFGIRIAPVRPDGKYFAGELLRQDLRIFVVNPFSPTEFQMVVHQHKTHPASSEQLALLVADLKRLISEVQGVTVNASPKD
jgi:hypothetical protein